MANDSKEDIGFVGLGAMGGPMCTNLLGKGFRATVFDAAPGAADPLLEAGARQGQSLADVARSSDVVITTLPNSEHVEAVMLGDGGIVANARPGALVIDTSTIFPETTTKVGAALAERGIGFIDAALGRSPLHAVAGTLMFMVGGDAADVERARPILAAMGDTIHHCGPVGSGVRTKLVNNYLTTIHSVITAEALALAQKLGLDPALQMEIMSGTAANNWMVSFHFPHFVLGGNTDPGFALQHARKDLGLAVRLGDANGVDLPTGIAALATYDRLMAAGYAAKDFSATLVAACEAAGVPVPQVDRKPG
jgi:4-hydroxybutyrate dehydrogenase/sulfolactaldehyde 3-reductase